MFRIPINKPIAMSVSKVVPTKLPTTDKYTFRVLSTTPTEFRITESGAYRVME